MTQTNNRNTGDLPKVAGVSDLLEVAGSMTPKNVVIPGGHREDDLRLLESARDHGIIGNCLLIGHADRIRAATHKVGIDVPDAHIFGTSTDQETAAKTVELVRKGRADIIIKGDISTPTLSRAILKLRVRNTMGQVTMFDAAPLAGGRPMFLTDPGVTTECTYGRLIDLIESAADVARVVTGIAKPRVALLSANEKVIPSLRSSVVAAALAERKWNDMYVCGPLSFDLATDMESVSCKGMPASRHARQVAGRADVLVCPGIDTANAVYKTIMAMANYGDASMAGITTGVQVPYGILSRSDPIETKLDSIALCCVYAERTGHGETAAATKRKAAKPQKILTINPGSTSTKVAVFENDSCLYEQELSYASKLLPGSDLQAEVDERVEQVDAFLRKHKVRGLTAVVGRGGFLKRPRGKLKGGTYLVADVKKREARVQEDIVRGVTEFSEMDHASNLGIPMAAAYAQQLTLPAYAVDPVVVDEFCPEAEFSGYAGIKRKSTAHALSIKAAVHQFAEENRRDPGAVNVVVGHLGGGITIAAIREGRMIDNTIALLGEGPFTPQRTGALPLKELIDLCYDSGLSKAELITELTKRGGLVSYLGDDRLEKIGELASSGDKKAAGVIEAMAYQVAKDIGAMAVAVGQKVEAVVLTGGMVRSSLLLRGIRGRIASLGPVVVYRESLEMVAMARGACRVLSGREKPLQYNLNRRVSS